MKKTIKIMVDKIIVNTIEKEVDYPETSMFFKNGIDGYRQELFAIICSGGKVDSFHLLRISSNTQKSNDFVPHDDCKNEYWLNGCALRKIALEIFQNKTSWLHGFTEISESEFEEKRSLLLNRYKSY